LVLALALALDSALVFVFHGFRISFGFVIDFGFSFLVSALILVFVSELDLVWFYFQLR
jgi:hypothetical protein